MSKKAFTAFLAAALGCLGAIAIITGILKDEKSFYVIAVICLGCTSILMFLISRSNLQLWK